MTAREGAERAMENDPSTPRTNALWDNFLETMDVGECIKLCGELERELTAAREEAERVKGERDAYMAVCAGYEYENVANIGALNPEFAYGIGKAAKQLTLDLITRAAAAEAALAEHSEWQQKIAALLQNGGMHDWAFIYGQIRGCIEVCERRGARAAAEGE